MKLRAISFLTLLLSIIPLMASAGGFTTNIRLNDDPSGKKQASPIIRRTRSGTIYVAWTDFRGNAEGSIYMARSTDGGATFSPNIPVYTGGGVPSDMQRGVQFAIDSSGGLHFVWTNFNDKGRITLNYIHSTDGGMTFSSPVDISGDGPEDAAQDFPSMAIDAAGNVYVAWVDNREVLQGGSNNTYIYATHSYDGGKTFAPPVRASNMAKGIGGSCECCNTSMTVSREGHIYISFRSNVNNKRDIYIARSLNRGLTFSTSIRAASESWNIDACPMTGSSIALDRDETAHVVWRDSRSSSGGKDYIYYTTLRLGDTICAPDMPISDSPKRSNYPSISIAPNGTIMVLFQDNRNDANDAYYLYSLDGGNSFSKGMKLSDETGTSEQMVTSSAIGNDGARLSVWQDNRRDDGDIYFSRDTTSLQLVVPDPVALTLPKWNEILTTFNGFAWEAPPNLPSTRNVLYDLTIEQDGIRMTVRDIRTRTLSLSIPPGTYRWWVQARTIVGTSAASDTSRFTLQQSSGVESIVMPDRMRLW